MSSKVLYLFNSALRPVYRENIYKILALPYGCKTQFRYSIEKHVPEELISKSLPGLDCIIVFIDRFSKNSYTYYPIRKGEILNAWSEGGRFFIECQLSGYCRADNQEQFTNILKNKAKGSPELTNNDPNNIQDGYYVQLGEDVNKILKTGDECWQTTVESISETQSFDISSTAFVKISLSDKNNIDDNILPNDDEVFYLTAGKTFDLKIIYFDPEKGEGNKLIKASFPSPLKSLDTTQIKLGGVVDSINFEFETDKSLHSKSASIALEFLVGDEQVYVINLPIKTSTRNLIFGTIFYGILFFVFILCEKVFFPSNKVVSVMCELIKWIIVFRIFIKLGNIPFLK